MLDINLFKQVNDRFWHDAGDRVLQNVAGRADRAGSGQ
ncbi:diguanylate cyclase domain-containing protein [Parazoarcus communis]|nr:diguanylate cyclase [Parazoarcus communis]